VFLTVQESADGSSADRTTTVQVDVPEQLKAAFGKWWWKRHLAVYGFHALTKLWHQELGRGAWAAFRFTPAVVDKAKRVVADLFPFAEKFDAMGDDFVARAVGTSPYTSRSGVDEVNWTRLYSASVWCVSVTLGARADGVKEEEEQQEEESVDSLSVHVDEGVAFRRSSSRRRLAQKLEAAKYDAMGDHIEEEEEEEEDGEEAFVHGLFMDVDDGCAASLRPGWLTVTPRSVYELEVYAVRIAAALVCGSSD
jgi:hypothetical protein